MLCTYNGERFLKEQLESIAHQTLIPYELVACDDASTDSTVEILDEFSRKAPFTVRITRNEKNLGLNRNCSQSASLCRGDYIATSDQDDIWLPDKLEASFHAMEEAEQEHGADTPILVHTDRCLIDTENHVLAPSFMKYRLMRHEEVDPLKTLLVRNFVGGCTCFLNSILLKESFPLPNVTIHPDWWIALIAATRGKILFVPEAKVLYRLHSTNITEGAGGLSPYNIKAFLKRLDNADTVLLGLLNQANELQKRSIDLYDEAPPYLISYINALQQGGIVNAFRILFSLKVGTQGFIPNTLFFYRIAMGRYKKNLSIKKII